MNIHVFLSTFASFQEAVQFYLPAAEQRDTVWPSTMELPS